MPDIIDDERKRRYMERQAVKVRKLNEANAQRAAEKRAILIQCIAAINALGAATMSELAEHMQIPYDQSRKFLKILHEAKSVYVCDYVMYEDGRKRVAVFKVGSLPDAPKEVIAEQVRPREEMEGEALARLDADKKHAAWAKQWTPHCDIAASWI